jgi:radical SAM superfamily enzyme YgiQ (UPF0313 family)
MLELGGIPLRAAARGVDDPLVIAGGPCAFNPEPLAPFLDAVVLGDGEEVVGQLVDVVAAWDRRDRTALLRAVAAIPGCYVPAFFEPRYADDGTIAEVVPLDPERPWSGSACCRTSMRSRRRRIPSCRTSASSTTAPASR